MNDHETNEYDEDVRAHLAPLRGDEAPPDREFLRGLRERSAAEFARARALPDEPVVAHALGRKRGVASRWQQGVALAAACLAGVALWMVGNRPSTASGVTLGDVLRRTAAARSLHLEVRRDGSRSEVWVDGGERVRWDEAPGKYAIARGRQLWRVDEAANTAARGTSPWSSERGVDLVALLESGGEFRLEGADRWLASTPSGRVEYLGKSCDVFEQELPAEDGAVRVAAYADAARGELLGLVAQRADSPPGPPLAELRLVAVNAPVDEAKFVVAESLTEDGRIGKVVDVQGLVALQPPLARRWTPVCGPLVLKPGDSVRTEARGANAVRVVLSSQAELTLGPSGLVELLSPTRVRVHSGEVQAKVAPGAASGLTLLGRGDATEVIAAGGAAIYRRRDADAELRALSGKPPWLAGFEGSSSDESLGSLIATVDGRSVPLSVGNHKVRVDIRDQIARTVVEESFVNHTDGRLEGVFHFPLPADASISGFGMWIGGELVEADVVEKQRAREIYETILREKRDPGLLEWTSGNLFKARVFPIEPHSEKRVKLVYTQVLPLRDNRYVYSYALRSELLRTRPLRELGIEVRVASELPLRSVACPTHDVRLEQSAHAANMQFAAQEYAPTRDFEVVCEIDGRQSDVVVIPHQRGEDGYFLVQLTPPAPAAMWRRETLGEGEPLDLRLLCDTSGSMDAESRRQQREFVTAVLGSLGPDDKFALATCDVECRWAFDKSAGGEVASATRERTEQALRFLDAQRSLGWTDLDKTFAAVVERATAHTQVIYVGDGVPSAGDADPQALAARLRRLYDGRPRGSFHAVAVGNVHDAVVLKAIAGLGGGSLRHSSGEQSPQRVALELLRELTDPGLRDLRVEFSGVQVAAVYPERLPNLPAGSQQILTGRYLPQSSEQAGELVVTGRRGDETVRYATRVEFPPGSTGVSPVSGESTGTLPVPKRSTGETPVAHEPEGNSFIPRLWARAHLDHLLEQGASQAIQDEIIALSEEFHIITPYTSLLVLESDADRERFNVTRRFAIRDGERFFADGRDNATYELAQQQMREAGDWRLGLRQQILAGLAGLGRDPIAVGWVAEQLNVNVSGPRGYYADVRRSVSGTNFSFGVPFNRGERDVLGVPVTMMGDYVLPASGPMGGSYGGFGGGGFAGEQSSMAWHDGSLRELEFEPVMSTLSADGSESSWESLGQRSRERYSIQDLSDLPALVDASNSMTRGGFPNYTVDLDLPAQQQGGRFSAGHEFMFLDEYAGRPMLGKAPYPMRRDQRGQWSMGVPFSPPIGLQGLIADKNKRWPWDNQFTQVLDQLVPALAVDAMGVKPPAADWAEEARDIAASLLRVEALRALDGGIEVRRVSETLDPRWDRIASRSEQLEMYSPTAWLTRSTGAGVHTIVQWLDGDERGALSQAFGLGRVRKATAADRQEIPLALGDESLRPLHETYPEYVIRVERPAADRVVLVLTAKNSPQSQTRLTIDDRRHVLLERQQLVDGEAVATTAFDDFVEIGGVWWAQQIITRDGDEAITSRVTQTIKPLNAEEFAARYAEEHPTRAGRRGLPTPSAPAPALLIRFPLPRLQQAKEAVAAGSAGVEAHLVMLLDAASRQQWDEAFKRLAVIETLAQPQTDDDAANSPDQAWSGLPWIRLALEQQARRNAAALERMTTEAQRLVDGERNDEFFVANHLLNVAASIADANEQLRLLDALRPTFVDQPQHAGALISWMERRVALLSSLERTEESLVQHRELAGAVPWDAARQIAYANDLSSAGERDPAYAWLQEQLDRHPRRSEGDKDQLVIAYADLLYWEGRYAEAADYLKRRVDQQPDESQVYEFWLSALVFADRLAEAEATADQWLQWGAERRGEGELSPSELARLRAAVEYACGERRRISVYRVEEKWRAKLAPVVLRLATDEQYSSITARIMGSGQFSDSDEGDAVCRELFARLKNEVDSLPPAHVASLVSWTLGGAPEASDDEWRAIADVIRRRWSEAADPQDKNSLDQALVTIYPARLADSEYLPFLRARVAAATDMRAEYARQLLQAIVARPWSAELETEAFGLLAKVSEAEEPVDKLAIQLPALYQLVDRMTGARVEHDRRELQASAEFDKLTRAEVAAKNAEFLQAAREGVAARLDAAADGAAEPLAKWLRIERFTLDVQLERELDGAAAACWEILGDAPPASPALPDAESIDDLAATERTYRAALVDGIYRQRALAIVTYLAVRRDADAAVVTPIANAAGTVHEAASFVRGSGDAGSVAHVAIGISTDAALVERLLNYLDAGIAAGGDAAQAWRGAKHDLLVALDRPDDLQPELREWIAADGPVSPWRPSLGRLLAERGQLQEAIGVFEAIRANDALPPGDLMALANWYLAVDRRSDYERATVDAYMMADEGTLRSSIDNSFERWRRTDLPLPSELDEHVLLVFEALFRKSTSPSDYAGLLREYYQACRDFRLLRMVPGAALGRTPQQIYPFLESLQSQLLAEVRDEAVADEILARIGELRGGELSPLDARALDLLEAMVERRAAEVLNQPGPHAEAAVAALARAFRGEWAEGEPVQMARLLAQLGKIAAPALAEEQVRQLRELHRQAEAGSLERLQIAAWLGHALFRSYDRQDEGLAVLQSATGEFDLTRNGVWPETAIEPLETYLGLLEQRSRYAEAEALLVHLMVKPEDYDMTKWFTERLDGVYLAALAGNGQTSLGRGAELYHNLVQRIDGELATDNQSLRYQLVRRLMVVFDHANDVPALADAAKQDLRRFAFERLPGVLARQTSNYDSLVQSTAERVKDVLGPRAGLEFLVERMEAYPPWLNMAWDNAWRDFGSWLGEWRTEVGDDLGELQPRLLRLVLAELRRDLWSRDERYRYLYAKNHNYYWEAQHGAFAAAAREVLAERRASGRSMKYIADYLYHGLDLRDAAIEALFVAHRGGALDEAGQAQLVNFLHWTERYGESIAILEPLVERRPDEIAYRGQLMRAYFYADRPRQLRELFAATQQHFRTGSRWTATAIEELAYACLVTQLGDEAVDLYQEAVALVQRQDPSRGMGGEELPRYYRRLAEAYTALRQTEQAVDAAASAVVSWGPRQDRRQEALDALRTAMASAADLDEYAAALDRKAAESGEDSPLLRKMLGEVLAGKGRYAEAETQLRAAIELEPTDLAAHQALVQCLDDQQKQDAAVAALLAMIDLDRRNLELLQDLADRLARSEEDAERAVTMLVEAGPQEAENHMALAERRERQDRWAEAIDQWQHVARLRSKEPDGLLKLAAAQIHQRQWADAEATLEKLQKTTWPARFGDLPGRISQLQQQIATGRD